MNSKALSRQDIHASILRGDLYVNTAEQTGTNNVSAEADNSDRSQLPERSAFNAIAYSGDKIKQQWAWWDVVIDVDGVDAFLPLPALGDHVNKCSSSLGQHESVSLSDNRITSTGVIYPRYSSLAAMIYNTAKQGQRWQMSIAGPIRSLEEVKEGEEVEVNGRVFTGPLYIVRRMTLREITVVPVGADVNTQLSIK